MEMKMKETTNRPTPISSPTHTPTSLPHQPAPKKKKLSDLEPKTAELIAEAVEVAESLKIPRHKYIHGGGLHVWELINLIFKEYRK